MNMILGNGTVEVTTYGFEKENGVICGLALIETNEKHKIGEAHPGNIGRVLTDIFPQPDLMIEFQKSESVQVVIDALETIKTSLKENGL